MADLRALNRGVRLGLLIPLLASASCGLGGSPTSPLHQPPDVSGTYGLASAGGQALPAVVAENRETGFRQEVTGGALVLRADRTFELRTEYRFVEGGIERSSRSIDEGTYRLDGSDLTLTAKSGADRLVGSVADGAITLRADVVLVYRK